MPVLDHYFTIQSEIIEYLYNAHGYKIIERTFCVFLGWSLSNCRCNNRLPIRRLQRVCSTICVTVTRKATMLTVSMKDTFVSAMGIIALIDKSKDKCNYLQ